MGDSGSSHAVGRGIVAAILETIVVSALLVLKPHEFWLGAGIATLVLLPFAVLVWMGIDRSHKSAVALVKANLDTAQERVTSLQLQLGESQRGLQTREVGLEILHKAAEAVRRSAIAELDGGGYSRNDFRDDVRTLLETRLREYLHQRLGQGLEYAVTIKWIYTNTAGVRKLVSVFRDSKQGSNRTQSEEEDLEGNYFYEKLIAKEHLQSGLLCLVVHDVNLPEIPAPLKTRAMQRDYRSCLTIPLNLPFPQPLEGFKLVGFLSVDAPKPWIFTEFFSKIDESREFGCQGQNHRRKAELNLLYGLADAIAAIHLLTERQGDHEQK